ncbi:hypothetical protein [Marininema halotolerans]|uniref:Uncharacterized protein n=1 Tax=Marininema halotolerans TaxID=1155944 RepID=A0A1I6Q4V4_9BACL|nr:hypothetical protein [Marininema halotolerans]SFS47388.1 hypothetical protein SAMN05444972_102339 [Marininema halotolerans]
MKKVIVVGVISAVLAIVMVFADKPNSGVHVAQDRPGGSVMVAQDSPGGRITAKDSIQMRHNDGH